MSDLPVPMIFCFKPLSLITDSILNGSNSFWSFSFDAAVHSATLSQPSEEVPHSSISSAREIQYNNYLL